MSLDYYTVETEVFCKELAQVRSELEPWEKELIEHKGKLDVARMESKLLSEKVRANKGSSDFVYLYYVLFSFSGKKYMYNLKTIQYHIKLLYES